MYFVQIGGFLVISREKADFEPRLELTEFEKVAMDEKRVLLRTQTRILHSICY